MWLVREKSSFNLEDHRDRLSGRNRFVHYPRRQVRAFPPIFHRAWQVAFDSFACSSGSEGTGFCGSKRAGSCFASARRQPIAAVIGGGGARHDLESDSVLGLLPASGPLRAFSHSSSAWIRKSKRRPYRRRPRPRQTSQDQSEIPCPILRHFWPPP